MDNLPAVFPRESWVYSVKNEKFEKDFDEFNKVMKLGLVKSCWIGSKTLNILAQNNSLALLFPKPLFRTKIKAFLVYKVVKTSGHFAIFFSVKIFIWAFLQLSKSWENTRMLLYQYLLFSDSHSGKLPVAYPPVWTKTVQSLQI